MALKTGKVTVASTATLIWAQQDSQQCVTLLNKSDSSIWLGGTAAIVGDATSYELTTGSSIVLEHLDTGSTVYGIVASTSKDITYLIQRA